MTAESAFCTNCGAVVGPAWESCEACGATQPVEVAAIGHGAERSAEAGPGIPASVGSTALTGQGLPNPAATYLLVIGGAFIVAAVIYLFATSGFPPGFTTTYEYHPDGTTSTSTSPNTVEVVVTVVLFLIGGVLLRASRAAKLPGRQ